MNGFHKAKRFVEKPDLETAQKYLNDGSYCWNSGMFGFTTATFLEEISAYQPQIYELLYGSFEDVVRNFEKMPSTSMDYAIMEKSNKVVVIPMELSWSDVGSWDSYYDVMEKDQEGNVLVGDVVALNAKKLFGFFGFTSDYLGWVGRHASCGNPRRRTHCKEGRQPRSKKAC